MAKQPPKVPLQTVRSLYISEDMDPIWSRLEALEKKTRVSLSRQVAVCLTACIDDLEKEMPSKREFILNGKAVTT